MISIGYFDWRSSGAFCWVLLKTKLFIKWNGIFFIYRLNKDCYLHYSWVLVRADNFFFHGCVFSFQLSYSFISLNARKFVKCLTLYFEKKKKKCYSSVRPFESSEERTRDPLRRCRSFRENAKVFRFAVATKRK